MHSIFVADASEDFRLTLTEQLRQEYMVYDCDNGQTALEALYRQRPDVLILDLMLPGIDGLAVLEAVARTGLNPITIVTSRFISDYLIDALSRFRVDYVLVKPCSVPVIAQRVEELLMLHKPSQISYPTAESVVTTEMYGLGIPTNLTGFEQARLGIMMLAQNPGQSVTKVLYPAIAAMSTQKTSAGSVERNIRTAIHAAWCHHNDQIWCQYFPATPDGKIPRPTNTQFLTRLADAVSRQMQRRA